ncbi:DNA polymerase III subunit beta family protein [Pseudonocardia sp. HH130630-07]|uniref:DNA polymerase III subunit beta family protein n=1 Tax=Pseudonocardia sp. HH130630-07 TaxID=1690815 RepID=UPI0008153988|nr:MerR family transcriptional regulator [Pseudonocardia sp. HH130630-07]ANY05532.1 transcriptional regulator [Pseudonocardia sp. HH130630-07]
MTEPDLMSIGVFARRCGLTPGALRFYDDAGLLPPAWVDPASGYRYYRADQEERAVAVRRLREIGMPLVRVGTVLDADPDEAVRSIDEHVARAAAGIAEARRTAAALRSSLGASPGRTVAELRSPVLADAMEQVLAATVHDPQIPVLAGVRVEIDPASVTLIGTDRYRLATRTLVPIRTGDVPWSGTLDGDQLRDVLAAVRRTADVRIEATPHAVLFRPAADARPVGLVPGEYPDHRAMLAALGEVVTRVTVSRAALLAALEQRSGSLVRLAAGAAAVTVTGGRAEGPGAPVVAAGVAGPDLSAAFDLRSLYPAVSAATGPDLLLDLRGPDVPMTVRSADGGDLSTVVMPLDPAGDDGTEPR